MASSNSIRRALLRPGHFLKLSSDRQLYVSTALSLGKFSVCQNGSHSMDRDERKRVESNQTEQPALERRIPIYSLPAAVLERGPNVSN